MTSGIRVSACQAADCLSMGMAWYLRVSYLDTKLTWSPLRAGNLIPWHRSNFSSRYEAVNTPKYTPFGSTKKSGNFLNWWATTSFSRTLITKAASHLVVHMSRLRRLVAAEAPVQSQGSPGSIYGGRSGTGTGFASSASVLSCQQRSTDAHIQSSANRRVAEVPRDLSLTPTVTIDHQQRHYREVNTNVRSGLLYQLYYEMPRNLRIHNYVSHVRGNSNSSLFTHTQM